MHLEGELLSFLVGNNVDVCTRHAHATHAPRTHTSAQASNRQRASAQVSNRKPVSPCTHKSTHGHQRMYTQEHARASTYVQRRARTGINVCTENKGVLISESTNGRKCSTCVCVNQRVGTGLCRWWGRDEHVCVCEPTCRNRIVRVVGA